MKNILFPTPLAMTVQIIWNGQKKLPVGQQAHKKRRVFCGCGKFSI